MRIRSLTWVSPPPQVGKDKRALKMAKRKLGTHRRAKAKREEISNLMRKAAQKKKQEEKESHAHGHK